MTKRLVVLAILVAGFGISCGLDEDNGNDDDVTLESARRQDRFTITAAPTSVTVSQGASITSTITTTNVSGKAQILALSVSGLPNGVVATFSPPSVKAGGTSTLTLAAEDRTPAGTYSLVVTGVGTSSTASTTLSLTVVANDFSITASPAAQAVIHGTVATFSVATQITSGGPSSVSLSIAGVPVGASATFDPAAISAGETSSLRVSPGINTPPGAYTLTITGTNATASHTTSVSIDVSVNPDDDFSLYVLPDSFTQTQSSTTTSTISTYVTYGNAQGINLAVSGLPSDVNVGFGWNPLLAGNSTEMYLAVGANAPPGTYALTLTGTSFSATHSVPMSLTIVAQTNPPLVSGTPISNLSGALGTKQYWTLYGVPAGSTVTIRITGGTGDADLYVRRGYDPNYSAWDCRPYVSGNEETCTLTSSGASGDYHVMLDAYEAFSGVTLSADVY